MMITMDLYALIDTHAQIAPETSFSKTFKNTKAKQKNSFFLYEDPQKNAKGRERRQRKKVDGLLFFGYLRLRRIARHFLDFSGIISEASTFCCIHKILKIRLS
jgi:hypothetical protein